MQKTVQQMLMHLEAVARAVAAATFLLVAGMDLTAQLSEILAFLRSLMPALVKEHSNNVLAAEEEALAFASFSVSLAQDIASNPSNEIPTLIDRLIERRNSIRPVTIEYERDISSKMARLHQLGQELLEKTEEELGRDDLLFREYEDDVRAITAEALEISYQLNELLAELNVVIREKLHERDIETEETLINTIAGSVASLDTTSPDTAVKS